jgi:VanZ family protein
VSATGEPSAWRAVPAVVYSLAVFYGGVIEIGPLPKVPGLAVDKVGHALAFAGLAAFVGFALPTLSARRRLVVAASASTGVGALVELVQSALPYRSAEWLDLLADALGAVLGALVLASFARLREGRALRASARGT